MYAMLTISNLLRSTTKPTAFQQTDDITHGHKNIVRIGDTSKMAKNNIVYTYGNYERVSV